MTQMSQQALIKAIVSGVGELIDARARTTEINMKAFMRDLVKESEERQNKKFEVITTDVQDLKTDVQNLKSDLQDTRNEIKATKVDLKKDIHNLRTDVAKKVGEHNERIEAMERELGAPSKH